jgi:hypothetical protein
MAPLHGLHRRCNQARKRSDAPSASQLERFLTDEFVADNKGESVQPIGFDFVSEDSNTNEHAHVVERHHRWINKQITSAAETGNISWLLQVVEANMARMNLINFSTSLHRVAKLALGTNACSREWIMEHATIQALRKAVVEHVALASIATSGNLPKPSAPLHVSEMRCLSIICWSCATLRMREESLFDHMARVSETRLAELKPFELSNMLWAFAKLSLGSKRFFDGMASSLLYRREGQFSPQCLSTLVWAFGTAKVHSPAVFTSVAAEITAKAHAMVPQGIANTVWAYARVQRQEAHLFHALAETAVKSDIIWTFKAQELSNIVWAFATVGLPHGQLFTRIAEVTVQRRFELPPQNVANMLWAYAKLVAEARVFLFPPLLELATKQLHTYKPQEVSAILWAAAKETGCPGSNELFMAVPKVFRNQLPTFTSQALACMVEAFVLVEFHDDSFFEAMMEESLARIHTFQPPSLCTLFRGLALRSTGWIDSLALERHIETVKENIIARLDEMQAHNIMHLQQSMELFHPSFSPVDLASLLSNGTTLPIKIDGGCDALDIEQVSAHVASLSQPSLLQIPSTELFQLSDRAGNKNRKGVAKRFQQHGQAEASLRQEAMVWSQPLSDPARLDEKDFLTVSWKEHDARSNGALYQSAHTHRHEAFASIMLSGMAVEDEMQEKAYDTESCGQLLQKAVEAESIDAKVWQPPPMLALDKHLGNDAWQSYCHTAFQPLFNNSNT